MMNDSNVAKESVPEQSREDEAVPEHSEENEVISEDIVGNIL